MTKLKLKRFKPRLNIRLDSLIQKTKRETICNTVNSCVLLFF